MNKPKRFIRFERPYQFSEFGVIVIGRNSIPLYLVFALFIFITIGLLIPGGIVAGVTGGESWGLLAASGIPAALTFLGLIIAGVSALIRGAIKHIKLASRIARGEVSGDRY